MRVLLDTCVWGGAREALAADGHEVEWAGEWEVDPGDEAIIRLANEEQRLIVTLDKDFGELAVLQRIPHSGIVRLVGIRAEEQGHYAVAVIRKYGTDLAEGAIVTVDARRVRIRPPEAGEID